MKEYLKELVTLEEAQELHRYKNLAVICEDGRVNRTKRDD